jgi:hypothetical protein
MSVEKQFANGALTNGASRTRQDTQPTESQGRKAKMKSWLAFGLSAVSIGVLVSVGLLAVEQGYADENDRTTKCTLATLKGRYLYALNGTVFPPAAGVTEESVAARAGSRIFYGDGTGTTIARTSINGVLTGPDLHSDLSYTVNADCTGTLETLSVGANMEIFIAPNGDEMTVLETDPGHVAAYSSRRVGPK